MTYNLFYVLPFRWEEVNSLFIDVLEVGIKKLKTVLIGDEMKCDNFKSIELIWVKLKL